MSRMARPRESQVHLNYKLVIRIKSQGAIFSLKHLNLKALPTCERPRRMPRLEACRAAICFSAVCDGCALQHLSTASTLPTLRRFNPSGFPRCELSRVKDFRPQLFSTLKVSLKDSCLTGRFQYLSVSLFSSLS